MRIISLTVLLLAMTFIFAIVQISYGDIDVSEPFRKAIIFKENIYFFEEKPPKVWHTAFIRKKLQPKPSTKDEESFHIFAVNSDLGGKVVTLRWDIADNVMLCAEPSSFPMDPRVPFIGLLRYPISQMHPNEPGFSPLPIPKKVKDKSGRMVFLPDEKGHYPPNYGKLDPVSFAYKDPRIKKIWYDIRGIDKDTTELYLSIDGSVSVWLYDGGTKGTEWKKARDLTAETEGLYHLPEGTGWKKTKNLSVKIEGPFRLLPAGDDAVVLEQGKWFVLEGILGDKVKRRELPILDGNRTVMLLINMDKKETLLLQNEIVTLKGEVVKQPPWGLYQKDILRFLKHVNQSRK
ncbi:MAG: hypothetical protein WC947_08220 [Elusimicrobiota bacterium]